MNLVTLNHKPQKEDSMTGPATAAQWNKPPIPLTDEKGRKVKFRLRRMSFAREIDNLPTDMLKLHKMITERRLAGNGIIYDTVAVWNKLRRYERYWTSFKFSSEDEYLAYYDLPDGVTLAGWTVMVNFFDKPTFLLLGSEVLSFMMRSVGQYQTNTDERKKDYQEIFDKYCGTREDFDKTDFYKIVRHYVDVKYERPLAQEAGLSHQDWQRQQSVRSNGERKRREVTVVDTKQEFGPKITHDFSWKHEKCTQCMAKLEVFKAYEEYIEKLETALSEKIGRQHLPQRPEMIKNLKI
ncbi:MAG: hypothetical protein AAB522_00930 [Patescibacteria group bacterium]